MDFSLDLRSELMIDLQLCCRSLTLLSWEKLPQLRLLLPQLDRCELDDTSEDTDGFDKTVED